MTLTHPPFSIAPLAVALLLTSPVLLPLLPSPAPGRCFRTWVLTIFQFSYLSLSLQSFTPTSVPRPSIFRKLAGMALPHTLTLTVLLQRNTRLFLFPLLLLFLLLGYWMRPNLPFLSTASHALLKPGRLLRWKRGQWKTQGSRYRSQKRCRSPGLHFRFSKSLVYHRQGQGWGMAGDLLFSLT